MASPHKHIVDFERPPVAEVALAVQFAEPVSDNATTLSKYWPVIQAEYPDVELQPPLPSLDETFEVPSPPRVSFQLMGGTQPTRYWFLAPSGTELVQVQPDRFGYNWRKPPAGDAEYPRYPYVRNHFESVYGAFSTTLGSLGKEMHPTWCEITYINTVGFQPPGYPRRDLSEILRRVSPIDSTLLPAPDNTSISDRFLLERDGEPYGRFYVSADPAFEDDRSLGYNLILRMIAQPQTADLGGVLTVFDEGRNLIVNTFRDITTPAMHKEWGLDGTG